MKTSPSPIVSCLAAILMAGSVGASQDSPPPTTALRYSIVALGAPPGGTNTPYALNSAGWVVGERTDRRGRSTAYIWRDGHARDLGIAARGTSTAQDINAAGAIVGGFQDERGNFAAFVLEPGGELRKLADLGHPNSIAAGINSRGTVFGMSTGLDGDTRSVVWSDPASRALPVGQGKLEVKGIDDSGRLVGWMEDGSTLFGKRPFFFLDGAERPEPSLRGKDVLAMGVSPGGVVLLWGLGAQSLNSSFVLRAGALVEIDLLPGSSATYAVDVNDDGVAVGYASELFEQKDRAILWTTRETRSLTEVLPTDSGWSLERAMAINSNGWIVGTGKLRGVASGFVLIPEGQGTARHTSAGAHTASLEPPSGTVLVCRDSFEEPPGLLAGMAGGSGWAAPWATPSVPLLVAESGLDERGGMLDASHDRRPVDAFRTPSMEGQAQYLDHNGHWGADGTTLWLRFMIQRVPGSTAQWGGVSLFQRGAERVFLGCPYDTGKWGGGAYTTGVTELSGMYAEGEPVRFVCRFEFLPAGDLIHVWIDTEESFPEGTPTFTLPAGDLRFDKIRVGSGPSPGGGFRFDALSLSARRDSPK